VTLPGSKLNICGFISTYIHFSSNSSEYSLPFKVLFKHMIQFAQNNFIQPAWRKQERRKIEIVWIFAQSF